MYNSQKEIDYVKKKKNYFKKLLFSKFFLGVILLVLEVLLIYILSIVIEYSISIVFIILFTFIATILIINKKNQKNEYKLMWVVFFNALPVTGVLFYFITIFEKKFFVNSKILPQIVEKSKKYYDNFYDDVKNNIPNEEKNSILNYLCRKSNFFPYINNNITYFSDGEKFFDDLIIELKKAEKFIFFEFFIVDDGVIYRKIKEILIEKAKSGVEIKFMYDGLNYVFSKNHDEELLNNNIEARRFAPVIPIISTNQNNRDHRKIVVIDNKVAYTGGVNIADEYANYYQPFGVWKDDGVKIEGSAVQSFTIMFLQLWYKSCNETIYNFYKYLINEEKKELVADKNEFNYIVPFTDFPGDDENVSENLLKMIFNYSYESINIVTPYLVLDDGMADTLIRAAKRGVDVKIITPHIPDKKLVFSVTRSNYTQLLKAGIKIYEFTKGFTHAKVYISDNIRAVLGTVNLDYRSLYLHYENGVYIYKDKVIGEILADFNDLLSNSTEITLEKVKKFNILQRFTGTVLKVFAPLL